MANPKISIIVPVYKVEKHLKRCVDSILAQTLQDIEIILIDDGSPDSCGEICDVYHQDFPEKIKVIHQENQGVSIARNAGLDIASGEYIGFVDSDDWIAKDMFEKMYNTSFEHNAQLVICDYYEIKQSTIQVKKSYYKSADTISDILGQPSPAFIWNKLFHNSLKSQLQFSGEISIGEDVAVLLPLIASIKSFVYLEEPLYYYFRREDSASAVATARDLKKSFSYLVCFLLVAKKCSQSIYLKEIIYMIAFRIINGSWMLKYLYADTIEFVNENLMQYFANNSLIDNDPKIRKIYEYSHICTIPKNIIFANFSLNAFTESEQECIQSWHNQTVEFAFVELNKDNCNIDSAPSCVQKAYLADDFEFVGDYFKLKYIYDNGGVALDTNIIFNAPIGQLRVEKTFFGFKNQTEINKGIYGSLPKRKVVKLLMDTYDDDDIFNNNFMPLSDRIEDLLVSQYGFANHGWNQLLKEDVKVYRCDILSYDMQGNNNVASIYNPLQDQLCNLDIVLVDKFALKYWNDDREHFWREKERFRKELDAAKKALAVPPNQPIQNNQHIERIRTLESELNYFKGEVERYKNSHSWKLTRPLRWFVNLLRKNKFTKEEVR